MTYYKEALLLDKKGGNKRVVGRCLIGLAQLNMDQGQFERAACLFGIAESWVKPDVDIPPAQRKSYESALEKVRARLGELIFLVERAEGQRMTPEQAISINGGFLLDTVTKEC